MLDRVPLLLALSLLLCVVACDQANENNKLVWNNPYPIEQSQQSILYSAFSEQPKHLDPARSYSADEYTFIAQIYEPPLQYHYLLRPYRLTTLTATNLPEIRYYNSRNLEVPMTSTDIAYSEYVIHIQPNIYYQPHPAFARDAQGNFLYHALDAATIKNIYTLDDFAQHGTRELTAEDYVYQIKRLADPALQSPIAGLMSEYIVGFDEYAKHALQINDTVERHQLAMAGVEILDKYRYRIRIKGVYAQFKYWLAMSFFAPMPWEAEKLYAQAGMNERNINLDWYPVGTGAFMLAENNPNKRMRLVKNPHFHAEIYPAAGEAQDLALGLLADAGKPMPFIEQAIFTLEKENIPYWSKFLQGYFDSSGIKSDSFDQAISFQNGEAGLSDEMRAQDIQLSTSVESSIIYFGFNMLDPVVGGYSERARLLRQAISIAIDVEEYISIFRNGRGVAAQSPLPPGVFGYQEGIAGINPYVYDAPSDNASFEKTELVPQRKSIEYAKTLMKKAGYAQGVDPKTGQALLLYFDTLQSGPDAKAFLGWLRKQYAKIGIDLVIRNTDYNRFQDKMHKGSAQFFMWGWNADYPDPENFFFLLYGPHSKVLHKGENAANYQNPQFDRLFEQMKSMPDNTARAVVISQMNSLVQRDAPWVFGLYPKSFVLYHDWLSNVKPNLMANNTLKYKRIDAARRLEKRTQWNGARIWPLSLLLAALILFILPVVWLYKRQQRSAIL
ncbi:MAG: ABC transporter substrate-binding protein [Gammaproteobacteria bacterium]|nr:ABC transporter substrate-binding protein [Gammaproteobacteria bacterium]